MKPLSARIALAVEAVSLLDDRGPTIAGLAAGLGVTVSDVRRVAAEMQERGRIFKVRFPGEKAHRLWLPAMLTVGKRRRCERCEIVFWYARAPRRACSRGCSASLSWRGAGKDRRIASIRAAKSTDKGRARRARSNLGRWTPEARAAQAEKNRQMWADPIKRIERAAAIKRRFIERPQDRKALAEMRRREWADPTKRAQRIERLTASKNTPQARAQLSAAMRARWRDPAMRAKYIAANRARNQARRIQKDAQ